MTRRVIVELTAAEARALSLVAGNGWGNGEFAEYLGNKQQAAATERALTKLDAAISKAGAWGTAEPARSASDRPPDPADPEGKPGP